MITPGGPAVARGFAGMRRPVSDILLCTKMRPSGCSTRQQEVAFSQSLAGAARS
jgi:hypothetical protein